MPEISEVKLTSEFVNNANKKRHIVDVKYLKTNKLKLIEDIDVLGKRISANSRGKELKLFFDDEPVVISLGMTGCFKNFVKRGYKNKHWKHAHIRFRMSDNNWFCWIDVRRFGKSISKEWNKNRGPDIFDDVENFKKHIFENIEHRLEYVITVHGIDFINDSKATNVNAAWYALESMNKSFVWILGGVDKGNDYTELIKVAKEKKIKAIIKETIKLI